MICHGDIEVEMLNALAYDCTCLGNHEFDNGLEELGRRLASVKCPVVCCNYDFSPFEAGKYIKPWAVVEKAGLRIGVIGVLTDITSVVSRETADRLPRLDEVAEVNKWAAYLHDSEHCDYVICLTHVGQEPATEDELSDQYLAVRTRGIDLFVGGHSHTFLKAPIYADNLDGAPVPIVKGQGRCFFRGTFHTRSHFRGRSCLFPGDLPCLRLISWKVRSTF